jgi:hypothetical protein
MSNEATAPRASTRRSAGRSGVGDEDRAHRIAEAAYFLARQRDFSGGDPVQDWLEAERMIDSLPVGTRKRKKSA